MASKKRANTPQFYESMPGTLDSFELFPISDNYELKESQLDERDYLFSDEEAHSEVVKAKVVRQGVILLALLALQVILFIVLIRSTVNLG